MYLYLNMYILFLLIIILDPELGFISTYTVFLDFNILRVKIKFLTFTTYNSNNICIFNLKITFIQLIIIGIYPKHLRNCRDRKLMKTIVICS